MILLAWTGILFYLSQSALLSGLNLGLFSLSKLELEFAAKKNDPRALRVLQLREALFESERFNPCRHCHRPVIVRNSKERLGELIQRFRVRPGKIGEDIVDEDVILLWGERPRVVTGTDILGRLLRGIAKPTGSG